MPSDAVCPKCGGTGFIITEHANLSGAAPCDCRALARAARLEDRSQIPSLYRQASFDNFLIPGNENPSARRELTTVLLAVKQFVRDFPNEKRPGLLLIGETGCGKTHLAVAALREIIAKGFEGVFSNYQELLNTIKAGYDPAMNSSSREVYQSALDAEVLLVDDLGANRTSDWVEDTINSIVTYRCDNRKPLLATTNMPDPDAGSVTVQRSGLDKPEYRRTLAEQVGARARSRLFEMCTVVRMPLIEDYRVRKGKRF
ncbi:MAG TPA: ATP-binding protein [Bryobacteraceae bacterium]|jgi:DNA replication protein DnaC|nr:ATP-binding protein [Bryobacteraceae bacterium]